MFPEVEKQLLADLGHYGLTGNLSFDWSTACIEGHSTQLPDGQLHNWSDVGVNDDSGRPVAAGWVEFIHGGGSHPLFVFWDRLTILDPETGKRRVAKASAGIPQHVWDQLPSKTKDDLCSKTDGYDSTWARDPLVTAWRQRF